MNDLDAFLTQMQGHIDAMREASASCGRAIAEIRKRWRDPDWALSFVPKVRR